MLKGQGGLPWVFIVLALTLIIVIAAVIQLHGAIDKRIKMDIMYNSIEVSGIINMLQAAPMETSTSHSVLLPIEVLEDRILIEGFTTYLIRSPVEVEPGTINNDVLILRAGKIRVRLIE